MVTTTRGTPLTKSMHKAHTHRSWFQTLSADIMNISMLTVSLPYIVIIIIIVHVILRQKSILVV